MCATNYTRFLTLNTRARTAAWCVCVCMHATTWFVFVRHKMYRFRLDITQVTLTWQAKGVPWTPRRWIKFRKPSLARVTSCLNPLDGRMYTITQKSCVHVTLVVLLPLLARD